MSDYEPDPIDIELKENDLINNSVLIDFKPDKKIPHPTLLFVGKRFAGKSVAMGAVADMYKIKRWAAWCGNKDTRNCWGRRFGSRATVYGADEEGKQALKRILEYQEEKVDLYDHVLKQPVPDKYIVGLVFDDISSKKKFCRSKMMEDLFSNGRHYFAIIFVGCQHLKQLEPVVRLNTDYTFMLHNAKPTCALLHKEYVMYPEDYTMFADLLYKVTGQKDEKGKDKHNALVFNNCIKSFEIHEVFSVLRFPLGFDPKNISLGCPKWQEFNRTHFVDKPLADRKAKYRIHQQRKRVQQYYKNEKMLAFTIAGKKGKSMELQMRTR
jgi:hypothetical protein